jgi:hypothetical protein
MWEHPLANATKHPIHDTQKSHSKSQNQRMFPEEKYSLSGVISFRSNHKV